jgi:crotonobetainyl-CoA:carnitine CoA-transferase CaiB-like acyl-CoA transferase
MDTAVSMLSYFAAWHLNLGWEPERMPGSGHQSLVPARIFETEDGWVSVFCAKEVFWRRLAEGLGREELLEDPRFGSFADRREHREELEALLEEAFGRKTTEEWLRELEGDVPIAPVNSLADALRDEQVRGPFGSWSHTHRFLPDGDGCVMEDDVRWTPPLGGLAEMLSLRHM